MSTSAFKRTSADVKLDIVTDEDEEDGGNDLLDSQSDDLEDSDLEMQLNEVDQEVYQRQPLVSNGSARPYSNEIYGHHPSNYEPPGQPPPPYDSQGEGYPLNGAAIVMMNGHDGDEEDERSSSPQVIQPPLPGGAPSNSFRYSSSKSSRTKVRRSTPYPRELKKTLVASLFMCGNFVATTTSLSIIHEKVPKFDPLPDQVLDFFQYQHWALTASETLLSVQCMTAILICIFHRHRFIVLRRVFLLLGLLYGYRAITMFVTVLPKANPEYQCDPKLAESGQSLTIGIVARRVVKILSGFGLSINGQHVYCGDFIFSGHTMTFVIAYLVMQEYTSRRLFVLHWLAWINALTGVALLMMGRGHYTVDIIIAYYISSRLWYLYHGMACHPPLQQATAINYFARLWWWSLFRWFEENVKSGPLPNGFNLPLPKALCKSLRSRSRNLVSETTRLTRNRHRRHKEEA